MWREHCPSLPLGGWMNAKLIEQIEESHSRTLNYKPSPRGNIYLIFPFQHFISCIKNIYISNLFSPL
jgi:hypothetical protein